MMLRPFRKPSSRMSCWSRSRRKGFPVCGKKSTALSLNFLIMSISLTSSKHLSSESRPFAKGEDMRGSALEARSKNCFENKHLAYDPPIILKFAKTSLITNSPSLQICTTSTQHCLNFTNYYSRQFQISGRKKTQINSTFRPSSKLTKSTLH